MTDPIANLIAAATNVCRAMDEGGQPSLADMQAFRSAIYHAKAAAEARPGPKPDDACDFYEQLPKGPSHGRFSASDRAELDSLKRKAFESARPEPAAEPSEADELIRIARDGAEAGYNSAALLATIDAIKALAREVRRG